MSEPLRLGVLVSGRGSNLQAVLDAIDAGRLDARVTVVISDNAEAPALERARRAGVPTAVLPTGRYRTRLTHEAEATCVDTLREYGTELVFLAGFMRVIHETILEAYAGRIINIHPSLLPAFPGLDAQRQALEHGVKVAGCTVHFVDQGVDSGPIIGQRTVAVHDDDTRDRLAERILAQEHELIVEVLGHFAARRIEVDGRRVRTRNRAAAGSANTDPRSVV